MLAIRRRRVNFLLQRYTPLGMSESLTYRGAGVDIDAATDALERAKATIRSTFTDGVVSDVGAFGGLFSGSFPTYREPVLAATIDGVGTKTRIARMMGQFEGLGFDIVHHSANDLLAMGARGLFFLDYFATARLEPKCLTEVIEGAAKACRTHGIALLGGETAEMPDIYVPGEIDIAGCLVGIAEKSHVPRPEQVQAGDAAIGLASNGLHTNGYTLARRALFDAAGLSVDHSVDGISLGEWLLRPHTSYFDAVWPHIGQEYLHGMAHITGGGLYENIPRALPTELRAMIDRRQWTPLPIFDLVQRSGNVPDNEMYRTFNMGVGFVLIVDRGAAQSVLDRLTGHDAWIIGEIVRGSKEVQIV